MNTTDRLPYISSTVFKDAILLHPECPVPGSIRGIEFSGGPHIPNGEVVQKIDTLLRNSLKEVLIHNYFPVPKTSFVLNVASRNPEIIAASLDLIDASLDLCVKYSVPYYSFHPGYLYDAYERTDGHFEFLPDSHIPYKEALRQFVSTFQIIHERAEKKGVLLVIENLFPKPDNIRTSLNMSFEELTEMLGLVPTNVGLLIDLGHLNITSHFLGFDRFDYLKKVLDSFGDRIFEIHLSSNNGIEDRHLPLTTDDWQLKALRLFRNCNGATGEGVNVVLEARSLSEDLLTENIRLILEYL